MRKSGLVILFSIFCLPLLADPLAYLKEKPSVIKQNGTTLEKIDRHIFLPNGHIWYVTHQPKGRKELINKKYGDYFFGLNFGRKSGTNGGWSLWNFLSIDLEVDGKKITPQKQFLPADIDVYTRKGISMANIKWPISEKTKKFLLLQVVCTPSHQKWLFFRVKAPKNISISKVYLQSYPSNSNMPPERERIAVTSENVYNLHHQPASFKPESPGIVFGSQYVQENDGCLTVFDNSQVKEVNIGKSVQGVGASFFLNPGTNQYNFALGYFIDQPYQPTITRFTGETQDIIFTFMKIIDWKLHPDYKSSIARLNSEIKTMLKEIKAMELEIDQSLAKELKSIKFAAKKAKRSKNQKRLGPVLNRLKELKQKIINNALAQLKK